MKRTLELTLELTDDGKVICAVYEQETGEFKRIENYYSPDEHPEFDADLGAEVYSWFEVMNEEKGDM